MFLPDSWEGLWLSLSLWRHIQGSPCWRRSCAPVQTPPPSSPHWELLTHPCSAGLGAGGDLHPVLPGQRALLAFDRKDWMKQRLGVHRAGQDPQRAGGELFLCEIPGPHMWLASQGMCLEGSGIQTSPRAGCDPLCLQRFPSSLGQLVALPSLPRSHR